MKQCPRWMCDQGEQGGGQSSGLAILSLPEQGDHTSTALAKSLETWLAVGMGRCFPALVGVCSPCALSKTWTGVTSREHPSEHWSLLEQHWGLMEQPLTGSLGWGISWAMVSAT